MVWQRRPAALGSMMEAAAAYWPSLHGRLTAAAAASAPTMHVEDAAQSAGRCGELDVVAELEAMSNSAMPMGTGSLSLFRGVRLPDPEQGGHKEIDVVCVSHAGICAIEVKNWSGRICASGTPPSEEGAAAWKQQRRGGDVLFHTPPITLLQYKASLLHEYLAARNVEVAGLGGIQCRLVMPNRNLEVDASILHDPVCREALVLHRDCAAFYAAFRETAGTRLAALLLPRLLSQVQLTAGQLGAVCEVLANAGTWDVVTLHGGASHTGTQLVQRLSICRHRARKNVVGGIQICTVLSF